MNNSFEFEIIPFESVGKIKFYQHYKEIQTIFDVVPFGKVREGKTFLLAYRELDLDCHVTYNEKGECIVIAIHTPAKAIFKGVNMLAMEHETFKGWIFEIDEEVECGDIGDALVYTSRKFGMEFLFREEDDENCNFIRYYIDCIDFFPNSDCGNFIPATH